MIQLNLTPQETVILYGFLAGILEKVQTTELTLRDRENSIALIESILGKVATQLETSSTNN
jgi:hypothetical protein